MVGKLSDIANTFVPTIKSGQEPSTKIQTQITVPAGTVQAAQQGVKRNWTLTGTTL